MGNLMSQKEVNRAQVLDMLKEDKTEFCEQPLCGLPARIIALRFFKPDRLLGLLVIF